MIGAATAVVLIAAAGTTIYQAMSPSASDRQDGRGAAPIPGSNQHSSSVAAPHTGNLLPDPGVEQSSSGWTTFGAGVLDRVNTSHGGQHALRVTTAETGPNSAGATSRPLRATAIAGRTYRASCWVRSSASIGAFVQVQEYTKAWKRASDPTVSSKETLADPERWYQVSVTHVAATSGNLLPLSVFSNGLRADGAYLLVDDCSLTAG